MSGSVNKAILLGNLVADPDVRQSRDGKSIVNMRVATNERWRDRNSGEQKEKAEFHRVVIFNEGLAKIAEQYLKKGSQVYLEGQIQTRKWIDQQGVERYSTEIVLGPYRSTLTLLGDGRSSNDYGSDEPRAAPMVRSADDSDIPF